MTENIVVRGFVATYPTLKHLPNGVPVVNFRVASTPRWFDNATQTWKEGNTNWYTVNAFRQLARNACSSLQIGHPVFISGKLKVRSWEREDGSTGSSVEIDAHTLGHDLALGTAGFQRNVYPQAPASNNAEQNQQQMSGNQQTAQEAEQNAGNENVNQQPDHYQQESKKQANPWGSPSNGTAESDKNSGVGHQSQDENLNYDDFSFVEDEEKEPAMA